jgi:hypothetical protein
LQKFADLLKSIDLSCEDNPFVLLSEITQHYMARRFAPVYGYISGILADLLMFSTR